MVLIGWNVIFSSGVPLPRPDRHSQKIYLARLGLSAKRLSSFLALAGRAAVSRLEAVFSLEVQSRCDRRRGRVVACRFCGRALPSRHVRSSSSLLPFSAPFSSHLVSSRLVSSADTSRNRLPVGNSWDPRWTTRRARRPGNGRTLPRSKRNRGGFSLIETSVSSRLELYPLLFFFYLRKIEGEIGKGKF